MLLKGAEAFVKAQGKYLFSEPRRVSSRRPVLAFGTDVPDKRGGIQTVSGEPARNPRVDWREQRPWKVRPGRGAARDCAALLLPDPRPLVSSRRQVLSLGCPQSKQLTYLKPVCCFSCSCSILLCCSSGQNLRPSFRAFFLHSPHLLQLHPQNKRTASHHP